MFTGLKCDIICLLTDLAGYPKSKLLKYGHCLLYKKVNNFYEEHIFLNLKIAYPLDKCTVLMKLR